MSSGYLEPALSKEGQDIHRALASLQEELEAIDYYHQRADVSNDSSLEAVLVHNRDDEMEHAMLLLEWLRRAMPGFDMQMKKFLFTAGEIILPAAPKAPVADGGGLGLANLK